MINKIDHNILRTMAKHCTKPKPGKGYKDNQEVKEAMQRARSNPSADNWKAVQNLRKKSIRQWETERIREATQGDWEQVRKLRAKKNVGWDCHYAEQQDEGEAHNSVHKHLQNIYETGDTLRELPPWQGEVEAFTLDELDMALQAGHRGKAVGLDQTSQELLQGICATPGGREQLLEYFNKVLCTAEIPSDWNKVLMLVIPKVAFPSHPGDLRPLAMGSATAKLFARLLLQRSEPKIRVQGPEQCCGKGRQCCDFLFVVSRLMQLEQEWRRGTCWLKVDLAKAFDKVDRRVLNSQTARTLGDGARISLLVQSSQAGMMRCLQTSWDTSVLHMHGGI